MNTISKPKIAILSIRNSYNYGGVLSSLKVMYDFCQEYFDPTVFFLGFDYEVATSIRSLKFTSTEKSLTYFGMHCVEIGARWAFWEPGHYVYTLDAWKRLLRDYNYFVVVSGTCIAAHPLLLLNKPFAQWIGTPYNEDRAERVKQLHGMRALIDNFASERMNIIEQSILSAANYTWSISSYAQQRFKDIVGEHNKNIVVCGYPLECSNVAPINQNKENMLLAVGRFSDPRKNIDMLIQAFEKIYHQNPATLLYVVGKKPSNEKLISFSGLRCFKNIIFTGQVSLADLTALYRRASLLLITSHQEGLGIVGLEAMLHGTPVIATRCGGPQDYVIDGKTGYLVDVNDVACMADKALYLLQNKEILSAMRKSARQHVHDTFSKESIYALFKQGLVTTYPELEAWFIHYKQQAAAYAQKTVSQAPPII